jgi:vacuolar iron transporter family protein
MTGTTSQTTGNPDGAEPAAAQTLAGRVRRSFVDSSGSIVFGMEDGAVSIFGLVFGVAAAAPDSRVSQRGRPPSPSGAAAGAAPFSGWSFTGGRSLTGATAAASSCEFGRCTGPSGVSSRT